MSISIGEEIQESCIGGTFTKGMPYTSSFLGLACRSVHTSIKSKLLGAHTTEEAGSDPTITTPPRDTALQHEQDHHLLRPPLPPRRPLPLGNRIDLEQAASSFPPLLSFAKLPEAGAAAQPPAECMMDVVDSRNDDNDGVMVDANVDLTCTEEMPSMMSLAMARTRAAAAAVPEKKVAAAASASSLVFSDFRTPPSKNKLLEMIRSANAKAQGSISSSNHPMPATRKTAFRKLARYLEEQLHRLYPAAGKSKKDERSLGTSSSSVSSRRRMRMSGRHGSTGGSYYSYSGSAPREHPCKSRTESVKLSPAFEQLLISQASDGMHGESMALFFAGRLDLPGFSSEQRERHACEYYWLTCKMQDYNFVSDRDEAAAVGGGSASASSHPWENVERAYTIDMSTKVLKSPLFKYTCAFVQDDRQIALMHRLMDLTVSACKGESTWSIVITLSKNNMHPTVITH